MITAAEIRKKTERKYVDICVQWSLALSLNQL